VGQEQVEKPLSAHFKEQDWKLHSFEILPPFLTMAAVHPSAVEFKYQDLGIEDEKLQPKKVNLLTMTAWADNVQTVIG